MTATMPHRITINAERELYVIDCGSGYTCLGFDVCERWTNGVIEFLKQHGAVVPRGRSKAIKGTTEAYDYYQKVMDAGQALCRERSIRCNFHLTPELIGLEGKRVEVVDKYDEKRRFIVGKSCGWMPAHLELKTSRSDGGGCVTGTPFKSVRVVGRGKT